MEERKESGMVLGNLDGTGTRRRSRSAGEDGELRFDTAKLEVPVDHTPEQVLPIIDIWGRSFLWGLPCAL